MTDEQIYMGRSLVLSCLSAALLLGVTLLVIPSIWGEDIAKQVVSHPSLGMILGVSAGVLLLCGFVLLKLSIERGWTKWKSVVPTASGDKRDSLTLRVIIGAVFGLGAMLLLAGVGIAQAYEDSMVEDRLFPGLMTGILLLVVGFVITQEIVAVRPAKRNAEVFKANPKLVTSIRRSRSGTSESLRVLYEPTFLIGPLAFVFVDGIDKGSVKPGGALGMYLPPGEHLVTITTASRGGRAPLRAYVTLAPGQTTTLVLPGSKASELESIVVDHEVRFQVQVPDKSSKHTTMYNPRSSGSGDVNRPHLVREVSPSSGAESDELSESAGSREPTTGPSRGSLLESAIDPVHEETASGFSRKFGQALRLFRERGLEPSGLVPRPDPISTGQHPRWGRYAGFPLAATVCGSGLLGLSISRVFASTPALFESQNDSLLFLWVFGVPALVAVGVTMEIRRIVGLAPLGEYPGGLVVASLGIALPVSDTVIRQPDINGPGMLAVIFFVTSFMLLWWWAFPQFGPHSVSHSKNNRRQRSWEADPTLVQVVAGQTTASGRTGAIRLQLRSLVESRVLFGPLDSDGLYPLDDLTPIAFLVRPGTHRLRLIHECGASAVIEVKAPADQVVPITVGHPPGRLLWVLPRRRRLHFRVGNPIPGHVELSSG